MSATTPVLDGERTVLAKAEGDLVALRGTMATTLISQSLPEPRTVRVLPRGNWLDETGEIVEPATPAALPALGVTDRRANRRPSFMPERPTSSPPVLPRSARSRRIFT